MCEKFSNRVLLYTKLFSHVIFALNEQLHSGEKRLIQFAKNNCCSKTISLTEMVSLIFYGDLMIKNHFSLSIKYAFNKSALSFKFLITGAWL